jgi:hypothetical protein
MKDSSSFPHELIKTFLEHGPRPETGDFVSVLVGLHGAAASIMNACDSEELDASIPLMEPVYDLLARYRPVTLNGLSQLAAWLVNDMEVNAAPNCDIRVAKVVAEAARELARMELEAKAQPLRLDSPLFTGEWK